MKDFSWKYFALSGDVESYLLFKEMEEQNDSIDTNALGIQEDQQEVILDLGEI